MLMAMNSGGADSAKGVFRPLYRINPDSIMQGARPMLKDYLSEKDESLGRADIIAALSRFIAQRPGLEFGNYGDVTSYRAEIRSIARDLRDARALLRAVRLSGITGQALAEAFPRAFAGRLSWDGKALDYCTGQYWPTEYRRAVCAVLARALWDYYRDGMPPGSGLQLRAMFRKEYGRGIASRWFR